MVTHRTIEKSQLIRKEFPALADAVDVLGSTQIRNVGTIGANICTAAPSADTAPPLLVLGTQVKVKSFEGERAIPIEEFFTGPGETVLKEGEIVTELVIPRPLPYTQDNSKYTQQQTYRNIPRQVAKAIVMFTSWCFHAEPAVIFQWHPFLIPPCVQAGPAVLSDNQHSSFAWRAFDGKIATSPRCLARNHFAVGPHKGIIAALEVVN